MSTDIVEIGAVTVTRFAGGTASRAGRRQRGRCYQITEGGEHVELTDAEAYAVVISIAVDSRMTLLHFMEPCMTWIQLLLGLAPVILAVAKVPAALIPTITHAMTEAQSFPGASGADKKAHVLSIVQDGVDTLNAAKGKTVLDAAKTVAAVSGGIDTTIATIHLVQDRHAA